jgi:CDP-6-deoxy-D-xylo-4-hexulose-3-dehydrase
MTLKLCDVTEDFEFDLNEFEYLCKNNDIKYVFITHLLGFSAVNQKLIDLINKYHLVMIEDCCEALGSIWGGKKLGNFGIGSTFSFYYGHHMTTVEGGMVCTNSESLYHILLLLRSHGLTRELPEEFQTIVPGVDPKFTFMLKGYNVRNTEFAAYLGQLQLSRIEEIISIRQMNLTQFMMRLNQDKYHVFDAKNVSSFALPICCRDASCKSKVITLLDENKIEHRPIVGGNLQRQPFLSDLPDQLFKGAEWITENGLYIGNHQHVTYDMVRTLTDHLNRI